VAGPKDDRWEGWLIHGIRETLWFETQARICIVAAAALADNPGKLVPGIELESWLGRQKLQDATALRIADSRHERQFRARAIEDHIVIVPAGGRLDELGEFLADAARRSEVESRPIDRHDLASRDEAVAGRRPATCGDPNVVGKDVTAVRTRQVPVGVVRQTHRCGLVGLRLILDTELVAVRQLIADRDRQRPRIPFFEVRADEAKGCRATAARSCDLGSPTRADRDVSQRPQPEVWGSRSERRGSPAGSSHAAVWSRSRHPSGTLLHGGLAGRLAHNERRLENVLIRTITIGATVVDCLANSNRRHLGHGHSNGGQ